MPGAFATLKHFHQQSWEFKGTTSNAPPPQKKKYGLFLRDYFSHHHPLTKTLVRDPTTVGWAMHDRKCPSPATRTNAKFHKDQTVAVLVNLDSASANANTEPW